MLVAQSSTHSFCFVTVSILTGLNPLYRAASKKNIYSYSIEISALSYSMRLLVLKKTTILFACELMHNVFTTLIELVDPLNVNVRHFLPLSDLHRRVRDRSDGFLPILYGEGCPADRE